MVLLREDEDKSPEVGDEPRVNGLVSAVGGHQNVGDLGQEALQRELLEVGSEGILVDVDNLVGRVRAVDLDHLVPVGHGLAVRVLHAALEVAQEQGLPPFEEPLSRWPLRLKLLLLLSGNKQLLLTANRFLHDLHLTLLY